MAKIVIPFAIAEADVNDLAATPITIASFTEASALARVPVRLEIRKDEGTAYTFTISQPRAVDKMRDSYNEDTRHGDFLVVRDGDARPFFYVDIDGFLDRTDSAGVVAFPILDGKTFEPGADTFEIVATTALSAGTGSLRGRLYFDEYPV